ncbi:MAG TPA: hypothetical protein VI094_20750 [Propionibacteriaceae bacterium]
MSRESDRFLAVGAVTQSDRLVVELVQRPDTPDAILIRWPPGRPSPIPRSYGEYVAIVRVLGAAQIELTAAGRSATLRQPHAQFSARFEHAGAFGNMAIQRQMLAERMVEQYG